MNSKFVVLDHPVLPRVMCTGGPCVGISIAISSKSAQGNKGQFVLMGRFSGARRVLPWVSLGSLPGQDCGPLARPCGGAAERLVQRAAGTSPGGTVLVGRQQLSVFGLGPKPVLQRRSRGTVHAIRSSFTRAASLCFAAPGSLRPTAVHSPPPPFGWRPLETEQAGACSERRLVGATLPTSSTIPRSVLAHPRWTSHCCPARELE
jgi:hypothetical protein